MKYFDIILFIYLLTNVNCEFKQIILWKKSRICRNIFNGIEPLSNNNKKIIKKSLDMNITKLDVNKFPKVLKNFPSYNQTIYKGVMKNDKIYEILLYNRALITDEYYSFYKNIDKACSFGQNIILSIKTNKTYDLTDEVILDKNTIIQISHREELNNLEIINLITI
jgi:hypothetical protein